MVFLAMSDSTLNGRLRCALYPFSALMSLGSSVSVSSFAFWDGDPCPVFMVTQEKGATHVRSGPFREVCLNPMSNLVSLVSNPYRTGVVYKRTGTVLLHQNRQSASRRGFVTLQCWVLIGSLTRKGNIKRTLKGRRS